MKTFKNLLFTALLFSGMANAQIGIGMITPNALALLDIDSKVKELLLPRRISKQETVLVHLAIGLTGFIIERGHIETNNEYGLRALTKIKGTGILFKALDVDVSLNKTGGISTIGGINFRIVKV